jgi:glutamate racemase
LVEQVEKGEIDSARTRSILEQGVRPLLDAGADTLVLACTHFPFVIPQLQAIVGEGIRVIDPAPAVARQIGRLLTQRNQRSDAIETGTVRYMSSGDPGAFKATLLRLGFGRSDVLSAGWVQDRIRLH